MGAMMKSSVSRRSSSTAVRYTVET